jgi:hypothetical protein
VNAGAGLRVRVQQDSHLVIIIRLGRLISHPYTAARIHMLRQRTQRDGGGGEGGYAVALQVATWNGTSFIEVVGGPETTQKGEKW